MKKYSLLILMVLPFITMANTIPLEKLIGQFNEKLDQEFVALDSTVLPVNKSGMYLQKEPTEQLIKAYHDFKKQYPNNPFIIVSATRNYNYQNGIWQRKWDTLFPKLKNEQDTAKDILKYSSMPGSSRHHWGTDVDITSVSSDYFRSTKQGEILYQWLLENMPKYGFCQPFSEGREGGYNPEEWHWSYKPIAKNYLQQYKHILQQDDKAIISKLNFAGHNKIKLKALLQEYVLDVSKDCY
ncbi:M15 family metallopeptidase [Orbus wheelerorum]|uniref:M15 family metallopeptidase n=1 Tax=Orbus wheelerorum TaxID=3074111 RepID=UPI00370D4F7F